MRGSMASTPRAGCPGTGAESPTGARRPVSPRSSGRHPTTPAVLPHGRTCGGRPRAARRQCRGAERPLGVTYRIQPAPKQLMRVKGGLTSRQGPGGEVKWTYSQVDFRSRAEELTLDLQAGLETVTPYLGIDSLTAAEDPFLNSRVLTAGLEYSARRLILFGPQRFSPVQSSAKPHFSAMAGRESSEVQPHLRPAGAGGAVHREPVHRVSLELRPFEVALTASRLQPGFVQELDDLGSGFLTSSFDSRALFASGLSWWVQSPQRIRAWRFRLHLEAEASGNLFHWIDGRSPETTTIPLPSLFGAGSTVQVARYSRWVVDLQGDWATENRNGIFPRLCGLGGVEHLGVRRPVGEAILCGRPQQPSGLACLGLGSWRNRRRGAQCSGGHPTRGQCRSPTVRPGLDSGGGVHGCGQHLDGPRGRERTLGALRVGPIFPGVWCECRSWRIRLDFGYFLLRCDAAKPVRRPDGQSPTSERWRIHPAVSLPF